MKNILILLTLSMIKSCAMGKKCHVKWVESHPSLWNHHPRIAVEVCDNGDARFL